MLTNPQVQAKINELKDQSKLLSSDPNSGEVGYKFNADGTPSPKIIGGKHEVSLGSTVGYQGGYHNHTTGIKMLAPADIAKLLQFAISQPNGNISDGYMGMIGSEPCSSCPGGYRYYHYIINFTGTSQELANYLYSSNWDLNILKKDFEEKEGILAGNPLYVDQLGNNLNNNGLEKLFFDTLKKMGMEDKVDLQRIENNGTIQNITLNSDGNIITATPCSQ